MSAPLKSGNQSIAVHGKAAASERAKATRVSIEKVMTTIEHEIEHGEGIYRYNGGTVNAAEVLRRAGLDRALLAKPRHRALRELVKAFVDRVSSKVLLGQTVVRKAVTDKTDVVTAELSVLRQRYHEAELEHVELAAALASLGVEVAGLKARNAELESENQQLRVALADKNSSASLIARNRMDTC